MYHCLFSFVLELMIMKKLTFFFFLGIALLSCKKEDPVSPYQALFGTWQLTEYTGGVNGDSFVPGRNGEVYLLIINNDFTYQRTLSGSVYSSGRINIEQLQSIVDNEMYDVVTFEGELIQQAIITNTSSALVLRDECLDCYEYSYSKR